MGTGVKADGHDLLIFDCDGVLLDTEMASCAATVSALAECGIKVNIEEIIGRFVGTTAGQMLDALAQEHGRPIDRQRFKGEKARGRGGTPILALPGTSDCLKDLQRRGQQFCVASSTASDELRGNLASAGLLGFFCERVFSADQVNLGKPAPDLFLFAAGKFGTAPGNALVIEDSLNGVWAARAAGMDVVGFAGGGHCRPGHGARLIDAGANEVFADWAALGRFLIGERQ